MSEVEFPLRDAGGEPLGASEALRPGVMQLSDSLNIGGAERVAVNLANSLPEGRFRSHLCSTRTEGPLAQVVSPSVGRLRLNRTSRFEPRALRRLTTYIEENRIAILHAHGTTLFLATAAAALSRFPAVIWHDHFGPNSDSERSVPLYGLAARRAAGVIAVNDSLAEWSRSRLRMPAERVWYVPNFVCESPDVAPVSGLPGIPGFRIVCVANLRPEKGHLALLEAMRIVRRAEPRAHLILVGDAPHEETLDRVRAELGRPDLSGHVSWLGLRNDVPAVLRGCDVGVLSSSSEGLPLALIEYAMALLPAVATDVGQCAEVLDGGRAGLLVPPLAPAPLANALLSLLRSPELRSSLAERALSRARKLYGMERNVERVCAIYEAVLRTSETRRRQPGHGGN